MNPNNPNGLQPQQFQQPIQPQYPQQAYAQPKKSDHTALTIILLVVGIFGVVFVGIIVLIVVVAMQSISGMKQDANGFVSALTTKDYSKAYSYFSPELQKKQSLAEFTKDFESAPFDSSCTLNIVSFESNSTNGRSTKDISGAINCGTHSYPTTLNFVRVEGVDKLIAYSIKP